MNTTEREPRIGRRQLLLAAASTLLFALVFLGCGPEFDPYWKINKFRVIAIQAEPVTLREGETTTLTAEAFAPDDEAVNYEWEWCPLRTSPDGEWECPIDAEGLQQAFAESAPEGQPAPEIPDDFFELGEGRQVDFRYPGSQDAILGLCEAVVEQIQGLPEDSPLAGAIPVVDCDRGFEVSVRLIATSGDARIAARKRLTLFTGNERFDNSNPDVLDIQLQPREESDIPKASETLDWVEPASETRENRWVSLPEDDPLPLLAGITYDIRAQVESDSVEIWTPPAPEGSESDFLPPESEVIEYRWMVTTGGLEESEGLFVEELNTLTGASESGLTVNYDASEPDFDGDGVSNADDNCAPLANREQRDSNDDGVGDACDIYVWSVVRDGRLGVDWVRRQFRVSHW